jgi:tRNA (adenine57-N1/adenine58-N1)-methyltransferase
MSGAVTDVFSEGDTVEFLLFGKGAPYMTRLRADGEVNVRGHLFPHASVIGRPVGTAIQSRQGKTFYAVRPTLARWVESMPRFAKTIYPKDAGPILLYGDLFPGASVLEAGLGSGGLTLSLLRAIGPTGRLVSYDIRAESLKSGKGNVRAWHNGPNPAHTVRNADVTEGIEERDLDRVVLDLPEPWRVVPHAMLALKPGGLFVSFLPTILQVHELVETLKTSGGFPDIETLEVMHRRWQVGRRSVRPESQMVGHTGFLTFARFVASEPPPSDA